MRTPAANANGHRRRELRARVLAEETHCALCGGWVDKSLTNTPGKHGPRCKGDCPGCVPHDMRAEVDEDLPRSRGGSPYARSNTALMHRSCNRMKGNRTIAEHKAKQHATDTANAAKTVTQLLDWTPPSRKGA